VTWSATGGDIDEDGLYTAGAESSTFFVTATDPSGQIQGQAVIQLVSTVANEGDASEVPTEFKLDQNYPNPFNPVTSINYSIPKAVAVHLAIYDIMGRRVAVLVNDLKPIGRHQARFDARHLASGVYLYRINAGEFSQTRKMILLE
jgi:hypothetical protein